MRIICLQAENVKRLKAIRINPDKTLVKIEGRNGQGKSSVLDAIGAALGGGKNKLDMPVRKGEKRARIKIDLGDLVVERKWNASGHTQLVVTTAEGVPVSSPQAILDKLMSDLTFDPLAFVRMKPKEQSETLKKLAGLDFTELDAEREVLYAQRTAANKEYKAAEAQVDTQFYPVPKSKELVNLGELVASQAKITQANRIYDDAKREVVYHESEIRACLRKIDDFKKRMEISEQHIKNHVPHDASGFADEIKAAEKNNADIAGYQKHKELIQAAEKRKTESEELSDKIEKIDDVKSVMLQKAKFPLDGLGIDTIHGVTLNGIPFSQASSSDQLRTGVAIGLAENKRAKIMLIHEGSFLDDESLIALHKIAEEFDAQCFVERVADTASPSAVFIEDGEIVEPVSESEGKSNGQNK